MSKELIPYEDFRPARMNVNGTPRLLFRDDEMIGAYRHKFPTTTESLGKVAVSLFRDTPDYDYIGVNYTDEEGEEEWTLIFEQYELMTWMGAIALGKERQHILHHAERQNGSFRDRYGWNPIVAIEDKPSEIEAEFYIEYLVGKDEPEDLLKPRTEDEN